MSVTPALIKKHLKHSIPITYVWNNLFLQKTFETPLYILILFWFNNSAFMTHSWNKEILLYSYYYYQKDIWIILFSIIINVFQLLNAGFQVLYSSFWYLNFEPKTYDFGMYYTQDPRHATESLNFISNDLLQNIKGGEACMWTNYISDHTVLLDW